MRTLTRFQLELLALATSILAGMLVAATFSAKDIHFGGDFLVFWSPIAIVIGILLAINSPLAFIAGTAIALAFCLAAYGLWVLPSTLANQFAWLVYVISTPGALLGAIVGDQIVRGRNTQNFMTLAGIGALTAFIGLMINQMLVHILL